MLNTPRYDQEYAPMFKRVSEGTDFDRKLLNSEMWFTLGLVYQWVSEAEAEAELAEETSGPKSSAR
eukprot:3348375-Alexandrium_andersonii.AAC.1